MFRRPLEEFFDYTYRSVEPRTLAGRALKTAYFRGREFPAPQLLGAPPVAPFPGFPSGGDQPLTNFLRRGFLHPALSARRRAALRRCRDADERAAYQSRLSRGGLLDSGQPQDPRADAEYILRRACEGLLSPSILATGKSFNRLKHDTRMSELLDSLADDLLSRQGAELTRPVRSALRGQASPSACGPAL